MRRNIQILASAESAAGRLLCGALRDALRGKGVEVALIEAAPNASVGNRALALNSASLDFLSTQAIEPEGVAIKKVKIYAAGSNAREIYAPPFCLSAEDIKREELGKIVWHNNILGDILGALPQENFSTPPDPESFCPESFCIETRSPIYEKKPYRQVALEATLTHDWQTHHEAVQFFYRGGTLALLPLGQNQSYLVWTRSLEAGKALVSLPPNKFLAALKEYLPENKQAVRLESECTATPLYFHFGKKWSHQNKLLLGAAAHSPHPLAGQGLNITLEDIHLLCHLIKEYQALGLEVFSLSFLKEYERKRRAHVGALIYAIDGLARLPLLSSSLSAAALEFFNLTPQAKSFFAHAGASLLHNFLASSISKTGIPSRTG